MSAAMLLKDMLKIEIGTLLMGFTVTPFNQAQLLTGVSQSFSRVAVLNPDLWEFPVTDYRLPNIRTLFYPLENKPTRVKVRTAKEFLANGVDRYKIIDPFYDWQDHQPLVFEAEKPIGVHLGEFVAGRTDGRQVNNRSLNLYSKILLLGGQIGFIVYETPDHRLSPLELI